MKTLKTVVLAVIATTFINAASVAQGNCVEKGTIIVDAFYGFPYFNGTLLKAAYRDSLGNSNQVRNLNHFGGKFEIMLSEKIGVGLEGTWASATVRYRGNNNQIYTAGVDKFRILAKMNFHFATTDKLDPYLNWGVGYRNTRIYTNEPSAVNDVNINFLIPVAVRVGVGMRYFFTDIIGVHAEVGLGGPLMQGGLSAKF